MDLVYKYIYLAVFSKIIKCAGSEIIRHLLKLLDDWLGYSLDNIY